MKLRLLSAALLAALALFSPASAQEAPPSPAATELQALVEKITTKLRSGNATPDSFAAEIAAFEALRAKYRDKNEDNAHLAFMEATFHLQVLENEDRARELLKAVQTDFPGTKAAAAVERTLAQIERAAKARAAHAALIGQPAPALTFKWASQDKLKSLADLKGRVVVLDFWATWCGPCISSFPQIREHVTHFKNSPVTFLGVTSIQGSVSNMGPRIDTKGDEAKEMALMPEFMKRHEMTWDVAFSDQPVFNPDYGIQGIPYVAIIAPDGTVRHTGLHPGNPGADITGKIEALLKEFNLASPGA